MCLAKALLDEKLVMKDIARITVQEGQLELESLFGETKTLNGRIRSIDFSHSVILLEPGTSDGM